MDDDVDLNAFLCVVQRFAVATLVLEMTGEMSHRLIDLKEAKDQQNTISYGSKLRSQDVQYSPC